MTNMESLPEIDGFQNYKKIRETSYSIVYKSEKMIGKDAKGKDYTIHLFHKFQGRKSRLFVNRIVSKIQELNHINLPKYHSHGFTKLEEKEVPYLILEFVSGLSWSLYKSPNQSEKTIQYEVSLRWCYELSECISFLHSKNAFHGYINPDNILITDSTQGNRKICLLGLETAIIAHQMRDTGNNYAYMSSGLIRSGIKNKTRSKNKENDVYATAILCYEFLNNHYPFENTENLISKQHWIHYHSEKKPLLPVSNQKIPENIIQDCFEEILCLQKNSSNIEKINLLFKNEICGIGSPCYIAIVGSRASGKTCYISSLGLEAIGENGKKLRYNHTKLYGQGQLPDATILSNYDYQFRMQIPSPEKDIEQKYAQYYLELKLDNFPCYSIATRDYGGELLEGRAIDQHKKEEERRKLYDFFQLARGVIILVETRLQQNVQKEANIDGEIQHLLDQIGTFKDDKLHLDIPVALVLAKWDRNSYLFSLDISNVKPLNENRLTSTIQQIFSQEGHSLSERSQVKTEKTSSQWVIQSGNQKFQIFKIAGKHLFTIESDPYLPELKEGLVSEKLREEFKNYGHPISENTSLREKEKELEGEFEEIETDQEWELFDLKPPKGTTTRRVKGSDLKENETSSKKFTLRVSQHELLVYEIREKLNVYQMSWDAATEKQRAVEYIGKTPWLQKIYSCLDHTESIVPFQLFPVYSFIGDRPDHNNVQLFNVNSPIVWVAEQAQNCLIERCRRFADEHSDELYKGIKNYHRLLETENLIAEKRRQVENELQELQSRYLKELEEKWQTTKSSFLFSQLCFIMENLKNAPNEAKRMSKDMRKEKLHELSKEYHAQMLNSSSSWFRRKERYEEFIHTPGVSPEFIRDTKLRLLKFKALTYISGVALFLILFVVSYWQYQKSVINSAFLITQEYPNKLQYIEDLSQLEEYQLLIDKKITWFREAPFQWISSEKLLNQLPQISYELKTYIRAYHQYQSILEKNPTSNLDSYHSNSSETLEKSKKKADILSDLEEELKADIQKIGKLLEANSTRQIFFLKKFQETKDEYQVKLGKIENIQESLYKRLLNRLDFESISRTLIPSFNLTSMEMEQRHLNIESWQAHCRSCLKFSNQGELAERCRDTIEKLGKLAQINELIRSEQASMKENQKVLKQYNDRQIRYSLAPENSLREDREKLLFLVRSTTQLQEQLTLLKQNLKNRSNNEFKVLRNSDALSLRNQVQEKENQLSLIKREFKSLQQKCDSFIYQHVLNQYEEKLNEARPQGEEFVVSLISSQQKIQALDRFLEEKTLGLEYQSEDGSQIEGRKSRLRTRRNTMMEKLELAQRYYQEWKENVAERKGENPYDSATREIKELSGSGEMGELFQSSLRVLIEHIRSTANQDRRLYQEIKNQIELGFFIEAKKKIKSYLGNKEIVGVKKVQLKRFLERATVEMDITPYITPSGGFDEEPEFIFKYQDNLYQDENKLDLKLNKRYRHPKIRNIKISLNRENNNISIQFWEWDDGTFDDDCGTVTLDIYPLLDVPLDRASLNPVRKFHRCKNHDSSYIDLEFERSSQGTISPSFPEWNNWD